MAQIKIYKSTSAPGSRLDNSRGGGPGPPLFWVKKKELQKEGKPPKKATKASHQSKHWETGLSSLAQGLDLPLKTITKFPNFV